MDPIAREPIRPDWMFQVRSACQSFACMSWRAERPEFERALATLRDSVPSAQSVQEHNELHTHLRLCAVAAGTAFHGEYHHRSRLQACQGYAIESALNAWRQSDGDPRAQLGQWASRFLSIFDATHPTLPCERAAAILRKRFQNPPALEELAAEAGSSKTALTRSFRQRYGMSCGEYLTRVRLLWFIDALRASTSSSADIAADAGYSSYHNLSEALQRRTGSTPGHIRGLNHDRLREIRRRLALDESS